MLPLILTLCLDEASSSFFDTLRRRYFPPERNFLQAHLTLFHHLPHTPQCIDAVQKAAAATNGPLHLQVTGLQKLGGGVAYQLQSKELVHLHGSLQQQWLPLLTAQDRQPLRPHVTIQNKVSAPVAAALYQQLSDQFQPFEAKGLGLELWVYKGGPWSWLTGFSFAAAE